MGVVVHSLGDSIGKPPQGLQLLELGCLHPAHPAEFFDQAGSPLVPKSGDVVEHRSGHALVAELPVVGDGKPMALVTNPLEEVQGLGLTRNADRRRPARDEDLLELLGQRRDWDLAGVVRQAGRNLDNESQISASGQSCRWPRRDWD